MGRTLSRIESLSKVAHFVLQSHTLLSVYIFQGDTFILRLHSRVQFNININLSSITSHTTRVSADWCALRCSAGESK